MLLLRLVIPLKQERHKSLCEILLCEAGNAKGNFYGVSFHKRNKLDLLVK